MNKKYHIQITRKSLKDLVSERALETIIKGNIKQDRPAMLYGHDHIHFDSNAFFTGFNYIKEQQQLAFDYLMLSNTSQAWESFGRVLHSWQDFYSHSNYIKLWRQDHKNTPPHKVICDDQQILNHFALKSGKIYGIFELLSMLPLISYIMKPMMPSDSHARMNLDSPASGPDFYYAYWAALKRTNKAFEKFVYKIGMIDNQQDLIIRFKDK